MDIINDLKENIANYYDGIIAVLPKLAMALFVCTLFLLIVRLIRKKLFGYLSGKADDLLLLRFIDQIFRITNILVSILIFLMIIGLSGIAGSILGAAGVSAFIIGFAFKDIGENFLAGIIMAFDRPFRMGDTVKTAEVEGNIIAMTLRDTHIKTFDGKDVYVPNGQILKNPLYNYTIDGFMRGSFSIGVDYESNIEQARKLMLETLRKIPGILVEHKPPRTHVKNLNTSTVEIEAHYWIDTFNKNYSGLEIKSLAQTKALAALKQAKIGMPADIIELKSYDDSFLPRSV